jgi:D-glycero-D-manno-heptose 1,7-bisphosphate phosphatase
MLALVIIVRYVFLDRDGVLNRKLPEGAYVRDWEQFEWLPGAVEAIARLNRAHRTVILVSNQRGIALGRLTVEQLELIHDNMRHHLAQQGARLDAIYYCPHDNGQCHCRKPGIGLFEQAAKDFPQVNADNSVVIGDSLSDIQAGQRLRMKTIFIRGEADRQKPGGDAAATLADAVADSLLEAVELHLGPAEP